MWHGCRYNGTGRYSQQNNNSSEVMMGKLETCGTTSAINCYDATHLHPAPYVFLGEGRIQPEDALTMVMNNVAEYAGILSQLRPDVKPGQYPSNEIIQYYPYFAKLCFGATVELLTNLNLNTLKDIFIKNPGCAVQGWLVSPNHFVCIKGFDSEEDFFRINDPWNGRDNLPGYDRKLAFSECYNNLQPYGLLWHTEDKDV